MDAGSAAAGPKLRLQRVEKKFWMTAAQYEALLPVLAANMDRDAYGASLVCSLYYDTPDFALIRRSIERPFWKEKLRLRSYGIPGQETPVFVELKRKLDGIGYKRRLTVPLSDAMRLLEGEEISCGEPQIRGEIAEFVRRYRPAPRVFLTYRRVAFFGREDPELRVTIDRDIRYKLYSREMVMDEHGDPVMPDGSMVLLEIKSMRGLPPWLREPLGRLGIRQAPFSKIGACYSAHIAPAMKYGTN